MDDISAHQFEDLFLNETPLLDVRAEIEFSEGHLPQATNLPILKTEERALVGTCYKQNGQDAAIALGHTLVSGDNKAAKLKAWITWVEQNPKGVLYCFRGGLRSRITQSWLLECGLSVPKITGGYKAVRRFFLEQLQEKTEAFDFYLLRGPTGSGKTQLLEKIHSHHPVVNLEQLARHKGSAFGGILGQQPSQINFENELSLQLMRLKKAEMNHCWMESESRLIGHRAIPAFFFEKMQQAPKFILEVPVDQRVENIFQEYILEQLQKLSLAQKQKYFEGLHGSLQSLQKKLGLERYKVLAQLLSEAIQASLQLENHDKHRAWIHLLLVQYYDPQYQHFQSQHPEKILHKGTPEEFLKWVSSSR